MTEELARLVRGRILNTTARIYANDSPNPFPKIYDHLLGNFTGKGRIPRHVQGVCWHWYWTSEVSSACSQLELGRHMGPGNKPKPCLSCLRFGLQWVSWVPGPTQWSFLSPWVYNRGWFVLGGPQRKVLRLKITEISSILKNIKDAGMLVSITYLFNSQFSPLQNPESWRVTIDYYELNQVC